MTRRVAAIGVLLLCSTPAFSQPRTPDAKRVKEIQAALVAHGFEAGKTWHDTQEICRGIAAEHHWQTHFAPDARVLILIGLGNKYSDLEFIMSVKPKSIDWQDEFFPGFLALPGAPIHCNHYKRLA